MYQLKDLYNLDEILIGKLIERGKKAQEIAEEYTQERVDQIVTAIAYKMTREDVVDKIAKMAVEESQMGNYEGNTQK